MRETSYRAPSPLVKLPARIVVMLSGRGSNFDALADACQDGRVPAAIVGVVSDKESAAGLEKARQRGIEAVAVARKAGERRASHEERLVDAVRQLGPDLICLAGFMRVLSPEFVGEFPLRILNIHPSLLPSFPGLHAQRQALEYGCRVAGATVHFVDSGVDSGPIVGQVALAVEEGETEERLSERILGLEHRLYAETLARVLAGGWELHGRSVRFPNPGAT